MSDTNRVLCKNLQSKIMSAEDAAALISSGVNIGMSGFIGDEVFDWHLRYMRTGKMEN